MNSIAFALYAAAGLADIAGLFLLFADIRSRARHVQRFNQTTLEIIPLLYNVDPTLATLLAEQPERLEMARREGMNEVIQALARIRGELGAFMKAGEVPWRPWLGFILLVLAAILGTGGNLTSSGGVGSPPMTCTTHLLQDHRTDQLCH